MGIFRDPDAPDGEWSSPYESRANDEVRGMSDAEILKLQKEILEERAKSICNEQIAALREGRLSKRHLHFLLRHGGDDVQDFVIEIMRLRGLLNEVINMGPPEGGETEGRMSTYQCCYKTASFGVHGANCWWVSIRDCIEPRRTS